MPADDELEIASMECGINLCQDGDEFTLDESAQRKLLMFFARYKREMFSEIVCPRCKESETTTKLPNSTGLILMARDEWKRREQRKGLHEEIDWTAGWISGFLTSKKFVQDRLEELRSEK